MKRIITLILLVLMAQLTTAQMARRLHKEIESTREAKIAAIHKKAIHTAKNRIANTNDKVSEFGKAAITDLKTLDSLLIQEWDDDLNKWVPGIREQFTYDENNTISETLLFMWSSNTMQWKAFQKEEYSFDTNGNLKERLRYYQFTPGTWNLSEKLEFSYDVNGNETVETSYFWNLMTSSWVPAYKYETTYDSNQNITSYTVFEWFPGLNQWLNSFKDDFFYSGGFLTSEISSNWNYGTSQWDYASQWLYSYVLNQLTTEIQQSWDSNSSTWNNQSKFDYAYNANTFLASEIESFWDTSSNTWTFLYKDEYSYGANNNLSEGIYYDWDNSLGIWEPFYKDQFVYDLNFTFAELIVPYFYGGDFDEAILSINNMLIGYIGYEYENGLWANADRVLFFYSDYSNALDVSTFEVSASIKVYPNPTSDFFAIDTAMAIDKVEIYSMLGHKVKAITSDFNTIPVDDLADGFYILKIQAGSKTVSQRILKR